MADNKEHICDLCHKRYATGYVMMGTGGHQIVKWLCPECAKQVNAGGGFFDDVLSGLDNVLQAMILGNPVKSADPEHKKARRVCPVCGATEEEIASNYKFGCSECYKVFYDLAHSYVAQLGGSEYKGKGPGAKKAAKTDDGAKRQVACRLCRRAAQKDARGGREGRLRSRVSAQTSNRLAHGR